MHDDDEDKMAESLGVTPVPKVVQEPKLPVKAVDPDQAREDRIDENIDNDYEVARANFHDIINTGSEALKELLTLSTQSQSARAYEVLSHTMKTLVDANRELVNLSKDLKRDIHKIQEENPTSTNNTNNNLYIGTSTDLIDMLDTLVHGKGKTIDHDE